MTAAYLLGVALSLGWPVLQYIRFARIISESSCAPEEGERAALAALHPPARLRLLRNSRISTPMLLGVLRPVLALPEGCDPQDLPLILTHELIHLRRGDLLYKWLTVLVTSLHWFNP